MNELVPVAAGGLVPKNMDEALRLAEFMAKARTVPKHLQDSPGDCLMVVELAMRWGMSPFAVAQGTSVISGKLMLEGKMVAAAVETSGAIVGHIDYSYAGEGEARAITVSATRRGETNPRTVTVTLKEAKTNNEMWKRQPDQQLAYHGVRVWARRWTPSVILGVYSREEMGPIIEGQSEEVPDEREALNASVPLKAAAADMQRAPKVTEKPPVKRPTRIPRTDKEWETWMDDFQLACVSMPTRSDLAEYIGRPAVSDVIAAAPAGVRRDIDRQIAHTHAELAAEPEPKPEADEPTDDLVIHGEEKLGAG
jgi:hypothetical protein